MPPVHPNTTSTPKKLCTNCETNQPLTNYSKSRTKHQSQCKTCLNTKRQQKRATKNPKYAQKLALRTENQTLATINQKRCTTCHTTKPFTDYTINARGTGYRTECRDCWNQARQAQRREDPEFETRRQAEAHLNTLHTDGLSICRGKQGCGATKPLTDFFKSPRGRGGIHSHCKECQLKGRELHRQQNLAENLAWQRARHRGANWPANLLAAAGTCTHEPNCFTGSLVRASTKRPAEFVVNAFVENLTRPCKTIDFLGSHARDTCVLLCGCGVAHERKLVDVSRSGHALCDDCRTRPGGYTASKPGYLYLIAGKGRIKCGITNYPDRRIGNHSSWADTILDLWASDNGGIIQALETWIKQMLHHPDSTPITGDDVWNIQFDGYTETWPTVTLPVNNLTELIHTLTEQTGNTMIPVDMEQINHNATLTC